MPPIAALLLGARLYSQCDTRSAAGHVEKKKKFCLTANGQTLPTIHGTSKHGRQSETE